MQIFIRKFSEVSGGRFSVESYQDTIYLLNKKLKNLNFQKLKSVILESNYGILPPGNCYNENNPVVFIRATELKEDLQIDFNRAFKVPQEFLTSRVSLQKGDILIAVKGATIGSKKSIAFVNDEIKNTIFNGSIFRIRADNSKIIPKCLAYILDSEILKKQCKANLIANNGVDYLDKEVLQNLFIPNLDFTTQQKIIDIMDKAYKNKKEKENKAKELLDSIDDYLLNELGIVLPKLEDKDIKTRIFIKKFSDLSHSRFDANYHQSYYKELENALEKTKYNTKILKELVIKICSGHWGYDAPQNDDKKYKKCLVIRSTEFDNNFGLSIEKSSRTKYRYIEKENLENLNIKLGDILIEKSGGSENQPVGRVGFITKNLLDKKICFSNFISKISLKDIVYKEFIFYYLNTIHSIKLIQKFQSQTNGIRNLNIDKYLNLKIPLPPLTVQEKMAKEITKRKAKALALQNEAKELLEQAKKEVEYLILA